ncbi:MAG: hypothetical protein AAB116_20410 [Candidatus Poribacteria bacterium]
MEVKKLEWAKPVLECLGVVFTEGIDTLGTCGSGTADASNCISGPQVQVFCYAGGTYQK